MSGLAIWWLFGGLIALSSHGSPQPSASAAPPTAHQSATSSSGSTINQATASGGSTINQAGGDLTVNQGGLSEEDRNMIREAVKKKSLEAMAELAPKYPHGYVIFGLAPNGRPVTYESDLKDIRVQVDWSTFEVSINLPNRWMRVKIPTMRITSATGGRSDFWANVEDLDFDENRPMASVLIPGIYYEVLDTEKRIFLVGFK